MKKSVLAMALTLTLVCGSFLGFLPGTGAMAVEAAGTSTVSGGDAGETLVTPTNLRWERDSAVELKPGEIPKSGYFVNPVFDGDNGTKSYEFEIYLDGELYKTTGPRYSDNFMVAIWSQRTNSDGIVEPYQSFALANSYTGGKYKYRVRAVSADGKSYSEWSEFSWEYDNSKEAYMKAFGLTDPSQDSGSTDNGSTDNGSTDNGSTDSGSTDNGSTDSSAAGTEKGDNDSGESTVTTVVTSSGETMSSAAAVNVTGSTPAVVRTPQGAVNAAAAAAVGGLKEGQYAAATVGDSSCGEQARQAVTNAASSVNGKVASYLEITLDICREGEMPQNVTQLSAPIEFTLGAPAGIDGNQYDFAVVRLHGDGRADVLPDLDSDPATITFQTDRFSVYAVIYGPKGSFKASGKDRVPKTGDSAIPVLPIAVAGAACGAAACALRKKEQG